MIQRTIEENLLRIASQMPVVTITGPRQSGKTTLAKTIFPSHTYINLETPSQRELAREDPHQFFKLYLSNLILDEVQRVPDLLSYIQVMVDESGKKGQFILIGPENLGYPAYLGVRPAKAGMFSRKTIKPTGGKVRTPWLGWQHKRKPIC